MLVPMLPTVSHFQITIRLSFFKKPPETFSKAIRQVHGQGHSTLHHHMQYRRHSRRRPHRTHLRKESPRAAEAETGVQTRSD